VPAAQQALEFQLAMAGPPSAAIDWYVDGERIAQTREPRYQWPLARGTHTAYVRAADDAWLTPAVRFYVR
jgi:penicillin-binding protein 1C